MSLRAHDAERLVQPGRQFGGNGLNKPLDSSAACSRRGSTTYIPVGVGGLFPTPLYYGSVFGELSRTAELTERPASMQAYIRVDESTQDENAISILLQNQ